MEKCTSTRNELDVLDDQSVIISKKLDAEVQHLIDVVIRIWNAIDVIEDVNRLVLTNSFHKSASRHVDISRLLQLVAPVHKVANLRVERIDREGSDIKSTHDVVICDEIRS